MRFPAMNSQRRQKVSIPKLNGGVNYRDAMNLVEDNQLTDVKNMWFKDGALRTRYGVTVNKGDVNPQSEFSNGRAARCFCKSSGITYVIDSKTNQSGGASDTWCVRAFDVDGDYIGQSQNMVGVVSLIVPFGQTINGGVYDAIAYQYSGSATTNIWGIQVESNSVSVEQLSPYVPTVMVSGSGDKVTGTESTKGYLLEGYNLLTNEYISFYKTDAESTKYYLPIESQGRVKIEFSQGYENYVWEGRVGDTELEGEGTSITATITKTFVEFSSPLPEIELKSNNLKVSTSRVGSTADIVPSLTTYEWFGGSSSGIFGGTRLFLAGDVAAPNRVYFSSKDNPLYFSENNKFGVGSADSAVTAFGKQSNMLVIFKSDETYFATYVAGEALNAEEDVMGNVPAVDIETLRATFPVTQLSGNIGCDLPSTIRNMQNRLMWADSYGRVWTLIYSSEYSTRNIRAIGGLISRKLKDSNINLEGAVAVNYDNYYMLIVDDVEKETKAAFVLDTEDYGYAYYTSYGSDKKAQNSMGWYAWELPQMNILFSDERAGAPLIFAKDGERLIAYTMADGADEKLEADGTITQTTIPCMFQTKLFDMRQPERDKSFDRVYISVGKSQELCAEAVYVTDKGNFIDSAKIACEGISDAFTAQFIDSKTLSPNIRAKRFALRMENNGTMYIDGISVYYR